MFHINKFGFKTLNAGNTKLCQHSLICRLHEFCCMLRSSGTLLRMNSERIVWTIYRCVTGTWLQVHQNSCEAFKAFKSQTKLQLTALLFLYFYFLMKIRFDISCESFAEQMIHMKYQVLFSLKNNENLFKTVVCGCSRDWRLKDL